MDLTQLELPPGFDAQAQRAVGYFTAQLHKTRATPTRVVSRHWMLYHVREHFAAYFGQMLLLRHMMQAQGVETA